MVVDKNTSFAIKKVNEGNIEKLNLQKNTNGDLFLI